MKTKNMPLKILLLVLSSFYLSSCVETTQEYYINKEGNGKVDVKAEMPLELDLNMGNSNGEEQTGFEDSVKMVKKVNGLIKDAKGIEAWDNLTYRLQDGMLQVSFTAYFPDVRTIELGDIPVIPVSSFSKNGIKWAGENQFSEDMEVGDKISSMKVNTRDLDETVDEIQKQFKQSKMMMGMMLSGFFMESIYHLPYSVKNVSNLDKKDDYTVRMEMSGDEIFERYEQFIEDDKKLKKLIKEKNIQNFSLKDPVLFKEAYPEGFIYGSDFRTGLFAPGARSYFDYQKEVSQISPKIPVLEIPEKPSSPKHKVYKTVPETFRFQKSRTPVSEYLFAMYKNQVATYTNQNSGHAIEILGLPDRNLLSTISLEEEMGHGTALSWSHDGNYLAAGFRKGYSGKEGSIKVFDTETGRIMGSKQTKGEPFDLQWVSDDQLVCGLNNNQLLFFQFDKEGLKQTFSEKLAQREKKIEFNPVQLGFMNDGDDRYLLTCDSYSKKLKIWDVDPYKIVRRIDLQEQGIPQQVLVSPNPRYIAVLFNKHIEVFVNGKPYRFITDIHKPMYEISWDPTGKYLVYLNTDRNLIYHGMGAGAKKIILTGDNNKPERFMVLDHTGKWAFTKDTTFDGYLNMIEMIHQ